MRVTFCDRCGAPIDAPWKEIVLVCRHCGAENAPGRKDEPVIATMPDDGRPRLNVGGRTYLLEGRLGSGDSAEVYRARWVKRLGELCVVKVLRALGDGDLLRREWRVLEHLRASEVAGSEHFRKRLPHPIAMGELALTGHDRVVLVFEWQSGFFLTLEQVEGVHRDGVNGRVAMWMLKRLVELLGWMHSAGVVHGAVHPGHVLVHPRDHGALLVGFATATIGDEALPAISKKWEAFYPEPVLKQRRADRRSDIAMAARSVLAVAGARRFDESGSLPGALGKLVMDAAHGYFDDALGVRDRLDAEALSVFGPPAYSPLEMPGWQRGA